MVDIHGKTSWVWRHWGCVTSRILSTIKEKFASAADLDGYDDLNAEDQGKIDAAYESGHVADEDIPPSARKDGDAGEDDDEDDKPKKKVACTIFMLITTHWL